MNFREIKESSNSVYLLREAVRLLRPHWPLGLFATIMAAVSGLGTVTVLATINSALQTTIDSPMVIGVSLAGLYLLTVVGQIISNFGNTYVGLHILAALRKELAAKILTAPIAAIERSRPHRLLAALNRDSETISNFIQLYSSLLISVSVTIGCMVYLIILSPTLFLLSSVGIWGGIVVHIYAQHLWMKPLGAQRSTYDEMQKGYRTIIEGAKELRINRTRRYRVHALQLFTAIDRVRDFHVQGTRLFSSASALSEALLFVAIGLVIALQGSLNVGQNVVSAFILTLFYVRGPIGQVISVLPIFGQAQIAFKNLTELSDEFANPEPNILLSDRSAPTIPFKTIEFCSVRYAYPESSSGNSFALGPIDLTIKQGEILFITGENGCGKTTLIKLILGLYEPEDGELLLNGERVTADDRDDYRQLFSTILFDYFLFEDVISTGGSIPDVAQFYLKQLDIAHKVKFSNGMFSTLDLSAGQRKRLALVQVYLEKRPIIVFDEWAAEQDPIFRRIFYTQMLPDLKRQGKTLIVISHDDRYFSAADRLIRMANGKIVE